MAESKRTVQLKSSDGVVFDVDEAAASMSVSVKNMIEDVGIDRPFPIFRVSSRILRRVIEYCQYHAENCEDKPATPAAADEIAAWDAEFVKVYRASLIQLLTAADYMHIQSLLDLLCQCVADKIKGKTAEEIRRMFKVKDEQVETRRETNWIRH